VRLDGVRSVRGCLWNTVYLERVIRLLQQKGRSIFDELLVHLSPLGWEHINLTGDCIWHANRRVAKGRFRPLRQPREATGRWFEAVQTTSIAVGMLIAEHPRTDPSGRVSRTGLPPWGLTEKLTGSSSYTIKPLGHAQPAQSPARALLSRVPLGPLPWLHQLRPQSPRFVRRLQCYYEEV
jgi:hypothetical protein